MRFIDISFVFLTFAAWQCGLKWGDLMVVPFVCHKVRCAEDYLDHDFLLTPAKWVLEDVWNWNRGLRKPPKVMSSGMREPEHLKPGLEEKSRQIINETPIFLVRNTMWFSWLSWAEKTRSSYQNPTLTNLWILQKALAEIKCIMACNFFQESESWYFW